MALSGGSTPRALHALLADGAVGPLPWKHIFLFFGDERCVPPDDPASNFRMARETMLERVPIPPSQIFRMEAEQEDRDLAARHYEEFLRRETEAAGGLDLAFLGLGEDAHTASLFPGSPVLKELRRWVLPADAPPNLIPRQRITLTLPAFTAAARVVFLVHGATKREALRRVRDGSPPLPPAAQVRARESTLWLVDQSAAE